MSQTYSIEWSIKAWIAIIILPIILFSWIRNLDNLAPLSTLANMCLIVGLAVILYDEIYRLVTSGSSAVPVASGKVKNIVLSLALFFGNAIFAFEGIGVVCNITINFTIILLYKSLFGKVLPLENKMKIPAHAKRVVYTGMLTVTILYSSFGLIGYLAYGDDIQASITLNLLGRDTGTTMSAGHIFIYLLLHSLYIIDCSCSPN